VTRRQANWFSLSTLLACACAACGSSARPVARMKPSPAEYKVKLETTKGDAIILVHREWSPLGADHFHELVKAGYYNNNALFRAIKGFILQWGISADPKTYKHWEAVKINDDPPKVPNKTGSVVFAKPGEPNARTTHVFVNLADNSDHLDPLGFTPFGEVIDGLDKLMGVYMDYGDAPPNGEGPDQEAAAEGGNTYFKKNFPKLDYINKATVIP
jgi:peptidyl-prolyl cis-trans isomerase A (cyclophilin A)